VTHSTAATLWFYLLLYFFFSPHLFLFSHDNLKKQLQKQLEGSMLQTIRSVLSTCYNHKWKALAATGLIWWFYSSRVKEVFKNKDDTQLSKRDIKTEKSLEKKKKEKERMKGVLHSLLSLHHPFSIINCLFFFFFKQGPLTAIISLPFIICFCLYFNS